jgi:hypothetical protein
MYGTTLLGGVNGGAGVIWEITRGGVYKDLHDFGGSVVNTNGKSGKDGRTPSGKASFNRHVERDLWGRDQKRHPYRYPLTGS